LCVNTATLEPFEIMKFLWEQDVIKNSVEFENGMRSDALRRTAGHVTYPTFWFLQRTYKIRL